MASEQRDMRRTRIGRYLDEIFRPAVYPMTAPLEVAMLPVKGEPITYEEAVAQDFEPFEVGQPWGGTWATAWFRAEGTVPAAFAGKTVVARVDLGYKGQVGFGGEGLVWRDGTPQQGIDPSHHTIPVAEHSHGDEPVALLIEAAANPYHPWGGLEWPMLMPDYDGSPRYALHRLDLAVVDEELRNACYDWVVLVELADVLGPADRRTAGILRTLDGIVSGIDLTDVRATLLAQRDRWSTLLDSPTSPRAHQVTAVGHAHIDSAWLWPLRETRRKCARTFSTAIGLMDEHEDFVFVCSQAQQHAWIEQDYPALFAKMKDKVAAGQLEPVGSMWVEPDTNLPSGESLVRQLVFGKRYFLDRYGVETTDCWLPDAFGYSGNLPQILAHAGVSNFLTQKLSWNETNPFPHHTFWWDGIDGSRVLAHCPPTDTYNGDFHIRQLMAGERQFANHGVSSHSLYAFGYGDGGGGPSMPMLERYRRIRDLDPLPRVRLGRAESFFAEVRDEAAARDAESDAASALTAHGPGPGGLPVWVGELYLERHRAVQTTQARSKLGNRRSEALLREAELWTAHETDPAVAHDVRRTLRQSWETVLLHQFHDILPGSSIHWVHQDSREAYAEVAATLDALIEAAAGRLADQLGPSERADAPQHAGSVLLLNAGSQPCAVVAEMDLAGHRTEGEPVCAIGPDGESAPVQHLGEGRVLIPARVLGSGWARYDLEREPSSTPHLEHPATVVSDRILDNGLLRVELDGDGHVISIYDHVNEREVVEAGARANVLQLHHDLPNDTDAWDVDPGTFDRAVEVTAVDSSEVAEEGPVRAAIRTRRHFGDSTVTQDIRLAAGSHVVEFATEVEWHEQHRMLKVAFPVAVRSPHATYEVQFGHVERPTHANTSWDAAKFEVPAQRWADLSEPGFGVALLNDCKYGYDIRANVMRLSLLRGPTWPDPEADQGLHRFSYAIYPHGRRYGDDLVTHEAERFNLPVRAVPVAVAAAGAEPGTGRRAPAGSLLRVDGAMVSAVKAADDGDGIIVRLYEHRGARGKAEVVGASFRFSRVSRTDALERPLGGGADDVPVANGAAELELHPFELVTLRLR